MRPMITNFADFRDEVARTSGIRERADQRERLYMRATLVRIPDGTLVEVASNPPPDDKPTRRERRQGLALVASIIMLAVFVGWYLCA